MNKRVERNYLAIYKRLWGSLCKKRKKQILIGTFLIVLAAITEMMSVLSLFPLLTILISNNSLIDYEQFDILELFNLNQENILIVTTSLFIFINIFSGLIRLLNSYYNFRLCAAIGNDFGSLVFKNVINRNYEDHIKDSSSAFITSIQTHVSGTIVSMQVLFNLVNFSVTVSFLIIGMLNVNFYITTLTLLIFSMLYLIITYFTKKKVYITGKFAAESNLKIINYVQEAFGAMRDIIIDQTYDFHINKYVNLNSRKLRAVANTDFLVIFPRYVIEACGLSIIALMAFYSRNFSDSENLFIPALGAFALGVQKLLPAIHQIYSSYSNLKFNIFSVNEVIDIIESRTYEKSRKILESKTRNIFTKSIRFENVNYKYEKNKYVLQNINFEIFKGQKVGIIGQTGGGKSTLVDLLMGLLSVSKGKILVDGKKLNIIPENTFVRSWRSIISHVPQDIFLSDSDFIKNIAFGVEEELIDFEKVVQVSKVADIYDYICSTKDQFYTKVGERGIQLSGGQRQRIGIARALYRESQMVILDEATSALDNQTEKKVLNSILNFNPNLTVIMIAHRLSSLKKCDTVIYLKNGKIEMIGKPKEVINEFSLNS